MFGRKEDGKQEHKESFKFELKVAIVRPLGHFLGLRDAAQIQRGKLNLTLETFRNQLKNCKCCQNYHISSEFRQKPPWTLLTFIIKFHFFSLAFLSSRNFEEQKKAGELFLKRNFCMFFLFFQISRAHRSIQPMRKPREFAWKCFVGLLCFKNIFVDQNQILSVSSSAERFCVREKFWKRKKHAWKFCRLLVENRRVSRMIEKINSTNGESL